MKFAESFLGTLNAMDGIIDRILRKFTRLWCATTGKSNFALARGTMIFGKYAIMIGAFWEVLRDPYWLTWLAAMCVCFWPSLIAQFLDQYERLESWAEAPTNTLPLSEREFSMFTTWRLQGALMIPILLPGALLLHPLSLGFVSILCSLHYVMHFDMKGGKTVWRKAFEKVKATGSKIKEKAKDLIPEPAPAPIPALVGS